MAKLFGNSNVSAFMAEQDNAGKFVIAAIADITVLEQVRKFFDDELLNELAADIKVNGVLQPVILRKRADGTYVLVAGERRYRAAIIAGLTEIPALVYEMDEAEAEQKQMAENIHRENLTRFEIASQVKKDYDRLDSIEAVCALYKKPASWVSKHMSLNNLEPEASALVSQNITADTEVMLGVSNLAKIDRQKAATVVTAVKAAPKAKAREIVRTALKEEKDAKKPEAKQKPKSATATHSETPFVDTKTKDIFGRDKGIVATPKNTDNEQPGDVRVPVFGSLPSSIFPQPSEEVKEDIGAGRVTDALGAFFESYHALGKKSAEQGNWFVKFVSMKNACADSITTKSIEKIQNHAFAAFFAGVAGKDFSTDEVVALVKSVG